jgi:hypothetical protein
VFVDREWGLEGWGGDHHKKFWTHWSAGMIMLVGKFIIEGLGCSLTSETLNCLILLCFRVRAQSEEQIYKTKKLMLQNETVWSDKESELNEGTVGAKGKRMEWGEAKI